MNHKIDQIAVKLTRPEKVRITSKTLREDVGKRLEQSGLKLDRPSPWSVKPSLNLPLAVEQGTKTAFDKESVVRLDKLLGEIVRLAPGQVANDVMTQQLRDDRQFLVRRMEGHEVVTTRQILGEERTLLHSVTMGFNQREPLMKDYITPLGLVATPVRVEEIVKDAQGRGEQLSPGQAEKWLNQFAAIHRYVCTSKDQFLNIRGGAGTGKTFSLEWLVDQSQQGGRPVYLCAPYGEQARVTLREEASRIEAGGRHEVARVFAQANRSALAMANMEAFHVKGTRHVQNVVIHVENRALYLEAIQRSNVKFSALHLERLPVSPARPEIIESPSVNKGRLLLAAREWGKEFVGRVNLQRMAEQVRQHLSRVAALRPRAAEVIKENLVANVAVVEKITPSVEEMAQKLREKVRERISEKQKTTPAPAVKTKIDWSPVQSPSHRQGRGIGL